MKARKALMLAARCNYRLLSLAFRCPFLILDYRISNTYSSPDIFVYGYTHLII